MTGATVLVSASAAERTSAALSFLQEGELGASAILADSRSAADELAYCAVQSDPNASFGLHRSSLLGWARRVAAPALRSRNLLATNDLLTLAMTSRVLTNDPVGRSHGGSGMTIAVARALADLRGAGVSPEAIENVSDIRCNLSALLRADQTMHADYGIADDRLVFDLACDSLEQGDFCSPVDSLLLLDSAVRSEAEARFATRLLRSTPRSFYTIPHGDLRTLSLLAAEGISIATTPSEVTAPTDLTVAQRCLFGPASGSRPEADGSVRCFSAPGESRECAEIARFVLDEVREGTCFDQIAVFLRSPETYTSRIRETFDRAGIPAYFSRGVLGPSPAVRRLLIDVIDAEGGHDRTWAEWIVWLEDRTQRSEREPNSELQSLLDELRPLSTMDAISYAEVRTVLECAQSRRNRTPLETRYGRVFVGTPEDARGRTFEVGFIPGLAERIFPGQSHEDPLLRDTARSRLSASLAVAADRLSEERLQLHLAVGAARRRLFASYPRVNASEGRARVPSFYALDLVRAMRGALPEIESFESDARNTVNASLSWPAPLDADRALDLGEHDLALLRPMVLAAGTGRYSGRARFLLELNPHLARSLRARWARWEMTRWMPADGLIFERKSGTEGLPAIATDHRHLTPFLIERFGDCPFRFAIEGLFGLSKSETSQSARVTGERLRRRLYRDGIAQLLSVCDGRDVWSNPERWAEIKDKTVGAVVADVSARLCPSENPAAGWFEQILGLERDLRNWRDQVVVELKDWCPIRIPGVGWSDSADVLVGERFHLSLPLGFIQRRKAGPGLRLTQFRATPGTSVQSGSRRESLPLSRGLHAVAVEVQTGEPVDEVRVIHFLRSELSTEDVTPILPATRSRVTRAVTIVRSLLDRGFLPPTPHPDTCTRCTVKTACGPYEEQRWLRKDARPLREIMEFRGLS